MSKPTEATCHSLQPACEQRAGGRRRVSSDRRRQSGRASRGRPPTPGRLAVSAKKKKKKKTKQEKEKKGTGVGGLSAAIAAGLQAGLLALTTSRRLTARLRSRGRSASGSTRRPIARLVPIALRRPGARSAPTARARGWAGSLARSMTAQGRPIFARSISRASSHLREIRLIQLRCASCCGGACVQPNARAR